MNHLRGIFPQRVIERRSSPENPTTNLATAADWLFEALGATKTASGARVNETTALGLTAVFSCVRVLAESVASIPLVVYRRLPNGGKERASEHPNYRLLHDRPNEEQPSFAWRETLMAHLALRGNAFVEKEYNGRGHVIGLWPIRPDRVQVERKGGRKLFVVEKDGRDLPPMGADRIMHIPGLGYDGLVGYSPISVAREAIGLGLAAQEHAARFFDNGAEPGGVLEHPGKLTKDAFEKLATSWATAHSGTKNAHKPAILEEGMKWTSVGISNRDSQFIENRKFQTEDIARIYRVPLHMIGNLDRATFSNIEQQSIDFVVHTIRPWLVRWEQVLNWELFDESERSEYFCEFNVDGLLRGDSAARGAFYTQMFTLGAFSVNDIREKENLNPVEGGDKRFVPLNMQLLESAGAQPDPAPSVAPVEEEDETERALAAFQPMVRDVLERALFREATAAKRAAKKGATAFRAWVSEYENEQAEYLTRSLLPVVRGITTMTGRPMAEADTHFVRGLALAEITKASTAYRSMEEPTEAVVADMLDRVTASLDATAKDITARIVGAITATPEERKAA